MATIVIQYMQDDGTNNAFKIAIDQATFDRIVAAYQVIYGKVDENPKSETFGQKVPISPEEAQYEMFAGTTHGWIDVANRFFEDVAVEAARGAVVQIPKPPVEIGAAAAAIKV